MLVFPAPTETHTHKHTRDSIVWQFSHGSGKGGVAVAETTDPLLSCTRASGNFQQCDSIKEIERFVHANLHAICAYPGNRGRAESRGAVEIPWKIHSAYDGARSCLVTNGVVIRLNSKIVGNTRAWDYGRVRAIPVSRKYEKATDENAKGYGEDTNPPI